MPKTSTCPECGESKRVKMTVAPRTDRFPAPIWRFECRVCDAKWVVDENSRPEGNTLVPAS